MNPLDIRKRMRVFALKMSSQGELTNEEYKFLHQVFNRIADGEDANEVLGVKFGRGKSLNDANIRQAISFIIHWIECAIQPLDGELPGHGYSVSEACNAAAPILKEMLGLENTDKYDAEYIRQCYYKPEFSHMRSLERRALDHDSPFNP